MDWLRSSVTSLVKGGSNDSSGQESPLQEDGQVSRFAPPVISAHITGHEQSRQGYTLFIINVTFGKKQWYVKRRYNQFYELNRELGYETSRNLMSYVNLPKIPPKKMCGSKASAFVSRRAESLGVYLQCLLKDERVSSQKKLRNFLSPLKEEEIQNFWNIYYPLLKQGASFNKRGTLFTRYVTVQLSDDDTVLEYWSPSEETNYKEDVKSVHIASIYGVRLSSNKTEIVVDAEKSLRLDTHEVGTKHQWLRALESLKDSSHLCCPATSTRGVMPKLWEQNLALASRSKQDTPSAFKRTDRRSSNALRSNTNQHGANSTVRSSDLSGSEKYEQWKQKRGQRGDRRRAQRKENNVNGWLR
jgi:hypothetical protein